MGSQTGNGLNWLAVIGWLLFGGSLLRPSATQPTTTPNSLPAGTNVEKRFFDSYVIAPTLKSSESLKNIKRMAVLVQVDDKVCSDMNGYDLKSSIELKLRQAGIKVAEKEDAVFLLSVTGYWDDNNIQCNYMINLSVKEHTHTVRLDKHYFVFSSVWENAKVCTLGRNVFSNDFIPSTHECVDQFLNDYLAAN